MLWIIIGIVGGTLFVGLSVFLLNPPEALLKSILDDDKEKNHSSQNSDEKPTEENKKNK